MVRRAAVIDGETVEVDESLEVGEEHVNGDTFESSDDTEDDGYDLAIWDRDDVDSLVEFMPDNLDLADVPTVAERQKQAKMAVQRRANDLLGHDIVWVAWREQDALLVAEGTVTQGFFAVGKDLTTNENVSLFIGGVALCKVLKRVKAPMRARLEKRGRTLVFA